MNYRGYIGEWMGAIRGRSAGYVGKMTPRTDLSMADTGCSCVPWEWCLHNPEPANHRPAFVYRPQHYVEYVSPENMAHIRSILAE